MSTSKSNAEIIQDLARAQRGLKKLRYQLSIKIQSLYDRWERNGIKERGTTFVPIQAVLPLSKLVSRLGKVERQILSNKSIIQILTAIGDSEK